MPYILNVTDLKLPYTVDEDTYKKLTVEEKAKYVLERDEEINSEVGYDTTNSATGVVEKRSNDYDAEFQGNEEVQSADDHGAATTTNDGPEMKNKDYDPDFEEFYYLIPGKGGKKSGRVDRSGL